MINIYKTVTLVSAALFITACSSDSPPSSTEELVVTIDPSSTSKQSCGNGADNFPTCTVDKTLPEFKLESNFFLDTSASIPVERIQDLPNHGGNDSGTLNTLIAQLSSQGGGIINIAAGEWELGGIIMKSNIHLFIDPKAVIIPVMSDFNGRMFNLGLDGQAQVSNVSIRSSSPTEKFTIDMSGLNDNLYPVYPLTADATVRQEPRVMPFRVSDVTNFMISGVNVIDKWTIHSTVNFIPSTRAGLSGDQSYKGADKGLVKDITVKNAHGGYGAVQTRVGKNLLFKNINSLGGGATLRLETDAPHASNGKAPISTMTIANVFGYNIGCKDGNSAVMIQPWQAINGLIDVQKINSTSCGAAVRIDRAFVDWQIASGNFTNPDNKQIGSYAEGSRVSDINTTYGTTSQIKQGTMPFIPSGLCSEYKADILMETFHQGPAISPLLYAASSGTGIVDERFYDIIVPDEVELAEKSTGFPSVSRTITRDEHKRSNCN